jgi:hypothetical protein
VSEGVSGRDWAAVKQFWAALISTPHSQVHSTHTTGASCGTSSGTDISSSSSSSSSSSDTTGTSNGESSEESLASVKCRVGSLPQWVVGHGEYGVTNVHSIHECGAEEFLGYHARGDKKKGNKRKTFALRYWSGFLTSITSISVYCTLHVSINV